MEEDTRHHDKSNKRKRLTLILAAVGILLIIMCIGAYLLLQDRQEPLAAFQDNETGLSFQHDPLLSKQAVNDKDKEDNIFFRLSEPKGSKEVLLVTARYEDGLKAITSVTHQDLRTALNDSIEKSFPKRYPEYNQLEKKDFETGGKQASQVTFTYKGNNGETVKQRFLVIIKDNDTAVYLSAQGKESEFSKLDQKFFNDIFNSARVQ
jgi:hypothetical protein